MKIIAQPELGRRARMHFDGLTRDQVREAICRMADSGAGDYVIAHATRLSVEEVRRTLAERRGR